MKKELHGQSTSKFNNERVNNLKVRNIIDPIHRRASKPEPTVLRKLSECLKEKDNSTLVQLLKSRPELIHEIDTLLISPFPPQGPFQIFSINKKHLLYKAGELIFSSDCPEVVHRNQKEWYYYYEQEGGINKRCNSHIIKHLQRKPT